MSGKIVLRTKDITEPPIAISKKASVVEVYNSDDVLTAVLMKVLDDQHWACTTKADPDWDSALKQLGYITKD